MGIYDKVITKLKQLPDSEDPSTREKIDAEKRRITEGTTHTAESLGKLYILARHGQSSNPTFEDVETAINDVMEFDEEQALIEALCIVFGKDGIKRLVSAMHIKITAVEELLQQSQDSDDPGWGEYGAPPNMLKMKSGMSIQIQKEPIAKVKDRDAFRRWCIKNGYENSLALHSRTTEAVTRERLERGLPEPDGVEAYWQPKMVLRK